MPETRVAVDTNFSELVSGDTDLRDADPARLALVLREAHAPMVVVRRPDEIVRLFTGR